jgi:hypothetical protein
MDMEERISRLEQDNRRWKQMTLLFAILPLAIVILMGAGREEIVDVLTVRELILKDEGGKVRGRIAAKKDGGIIQALQALTPENLRLAKTTS